MEKEPKKNNIKKAIIINTFLIVFIFIAFILLYMVDAKRLKLYIDNREIKNIAHIVEDINGKKYINLKNMLQNFKIYELNNGEYGKTNENPEYFYLESPYEIVQCKLDSDDMEKTIVIDYQDRLIDDKTGKVELTKEEQQQKQEPKKREPSKLDKGMIAKENFKLNNKIIKKDNNIYVEFSDLKYLLNLKVINKNNKLQMYTIDILEKSVARYMESNSYKISNIYQNRRAIIDGFYIIEKNGKYGVLELKDNNIENSISIQYDEIRLAQPDKNIYFLIEGNMGLKNLNSKLDVIAPGNYEAIDVYMANRGMYLVKKQSKLGIIDKNGKKIVPMEFDEIGLKNYQEFSNQENGKIIMEKFIPVMKKDLTLGELWGLYTMDGKEYTGTQFSNIGYVLPEYTPVNSSGRVILTEKAEAKAKELNISSNVKSDDLETIRKLNITTKKSDIPRDAYSLLYIPEGLENAGVIVEIYDQISGNKKYGIIDYNFTSGENFILPPNADKIYKKITNGKEEYIALYGTNTVNLKSKIKNEEEKNEELEKNIEEEKETDKDKEKEKEKNKTTEKNKKIKKISDETNTNDEARIENETNTEN